MLATDGCCGREAISARRLPQPLDTGTFFHLKSLEDLTPGDVANGKPLGGWEEDKNPKGMFLARPGIYFPLYPDAKEIKKIKGRGVGRGVILNNSDRILHAWNRAQGGESVHVANVQRFCGMKTSISAQRPKRGVHVHQSAGGRRPNRREKAILWAVGGQDGGDGVFAAAQAGAGAARWKFGDARAADGRADERGVRLQSLLSPDALEMKAFEAVAIEQPNFDPLQRGGGFRVTASTVEPIAKTRTDSTAKADGCTASRTKLCRTDSPE